MTAGAPPAGPVELAVFRHLFAALAEEMGARLMRSAYSPNIKERRDFSCAVFDGAGRLIAEAAHIPVHLGSLELSVGAVLSRFPAAAMSPGGRFVLNDPFAGGTHLPDITLVAPVALPGESAPRFFLANRAHHADVGGSAPGSMALATSIEDEGLRLPPTRLDDATLDRICAASRTPDERRGDLAAQLAALAAGQERLLTLCRTYGAAVVEQRGSELLGYTERLLRAALRAIPPGEYRFRDVLDGDGLAARDIAIDCTLRKGGGAGEGKAGEGLEPGEGGAGGGCALTVDFRASADQVPGPVNAPRAVTLSAVQYVLRCLCPPGTPGNAGLLRPVAVLTRPGSVLDAQYPAAVAAGNVETSQRAVDVLLGALSQALPLRIPAASAGTMNNLALGGVDPRSGRPFAYYETIAGGAGGGPARAGASAIHTHMTNTLNTPVEALEHATPLRVAEYRVRRGSGGAGRHAGGDGVVRRLVFTAPATVTVLSERRTHPPYGLVGGQPGAPGVNTLTRTHGSGEASIVSNADGTGTGETGTRTGETTEANAGKQCFTVEPGDTLTIATPGGGGWGK